MNYANISGLIALAVIVLAVALEITATLKAF